VICSYLLLKPIKGRYNMRIMITGAAGLVGRHLSRLSAEHEILALNHRGLDITDRERVRQFCHNYRPEIVINCAVIGVDECERDPRLAEAINVSGPESLAMATAEFGADFLHFSTNYVFEGEPYGRAAYTIDDELRPINVYGSTKVAGEQAVQAASPRSYVIRSSWIYGPGGQNFLSSAHRHLLGGERIRAITDAWASTTFVIDLVTRVREILARRHYGIYHVVNSGVVSYCEFALEAARLIGLSAERTDKLIEKLSEADAKREARRPRYTPMRCLLSERLGMPPLRDWREALADYVYLRY
jgi:dTDP-4-dehydrorhamnose reductase